jgi:TonB family protein
MNNIAHQVCFPSIGNRSPILSTTSRYTRTAYYLTNAFVFFIILATFGYVKYNQWQNQKTIITTTNPRVIVLSYAQLGPPPSIQGSDALTPITSGAKASTPNVGVPKPVSDELAQQETSLDQATISGITAIGPGNGDGTIVVDNTIPEISAYISHEVEPRFLFKPNLVYPAAARSFEYEGTVYVKALLDLDGSVMRIAVVKSSGYPILDSSAVNYIANAKFSPAEQHQKPVRVWIGQTITFRLNTSTSK